MGGPPCHVPHQQSTVPNADKLSFDKHSANCIASLSQDIETSVFHGTDRDKARGTRARIAVRIVTVGWLVVRRAAWSCLSRTDTG